MLSALTLTRQERASVQGAYDTLTEIGARTGWVIELVDEAHQKLGVILALCAAAPAAARRPGWRAGLIRRWR